MIRTLSAFLTAVATLLVVVSCTVAREPTPSPNPTASPFPQRPRDLPLDGVNPCATFTRTQLINLGVENPVAGMITRGIQSQTCGWARFPIEPQDSYTARLITTEGAAYFLANETGAAPTNVSGYGAVRTTGEQAVDGRNCLLFIDVADRQTLGILYQYEGRTEQIDTAKACAKAEAAAAMALETLSAVTPR